MNNKAFVIVVILATFMAFGLVSMTFAANNGPKTSKLEIQIFDNPDTENAALQSGTLYINDWPLTKTWIDTWALMPSTITMDSYVELGMYEVDINNQQWPTGDPNNKFYKLSSIQANESLAFRQAVAFLTDRDSVITQILKGYGNKMIVPLPPFQSAYSDMVNYTNSVVDYKVGSATYQLNASTQGITYPYNPSMAAYILDKAGFTLAPGHAWRTDPSTGQDLAPLVFYIRQDDPSRLAMGELLVSALKGVNIPVNPIVTEKTVCYKNVMVVYNYNLYTGGWSLSIIPNQYHDLYSTDTYYGPSIGWSNNYPGFCNNGSLFGATVNMANEPLGFDYWALKVQYPAYINPTFYHDPDSAIGACQVAGYLFLKYCAIVPVYCNNAVKAYRTGITGVVNNAGGGVDNYYTFLNGANVPGDQWQYGFKSNIEQLNQISSQWLWDQNVLGLMYETLMGTNPFNLVNTEAWICANKSDGTGNYAIGSWDASDPSIGGDSDATYINFTVRTNVYWHNGVNAPTTLLTPSDINWTFYFTKACGAGVAWNYPMVKAFNHTVITGNTIGIYFIYKSAWAFLQASGLPILNPATWGQLWTGVSGWQTAVRTYDPTTADVNSNGITDILEDGTGAWIFQAYVPNEDVTLIANSNYYLSQLYITQSLGRMFHDGAGDVNRDGNVNAQDLGLMARALGTNSGMAHGTGWGQYNPDCDLNGDNQINVNDLTVVTSNYGATQG